MTELETLTRDDCHCHACVCGNPRHDDLRAEHATRHEEFREYLGERVALEGFTPPSHVRIEQLKAQEHATLPTGVCLRFEHRAQPVHPAHER